MYRGLFFAGLVCGFALLSGCAYLTTYKRSVDLNAKSIAIDVKQRVVFGKNRTEAQVPVKVVCAEPSPDALTVLGATGALSNSSNGGSTQNATAAIAESGASIGLRTQSIQLLRDAMYRLCEGYASNAVTPEEFAEMQRRFQSTMLGLIAIEQLTGPVVASQAVLNASASGQAGASGGDAAVQKAQEDLKSATDASLTVQANLDTANSKVKKAQQDLDDNNRALADAKKAKDAAKIDSLTHDRAGLEDAKTTALNEQQDAARRAQAASDAVKNAQKAVRDAQSRANSAASGTGSLVSVAETTAHMQENLGAAVTSIVTTVNTAYEREDCLDLMKSALNSAALPEGTKRALDVCGQILQVAEQRLEQQIQMNQLNLDSLQKQLQK